MPDPHRQLDAHDVTATASQVLSSVVGYEETAVGAEPSPVFAPSANPGELGRLGPYRILKRLGHGGMGEVYLGLDERLQRKLALKVMLPKFAANPSAKARFLREARAAAQITHDNVVTVYEADELDGVPFIAMQFLQGYPLDEYLQKTGLPSVPQILAIGRETAAGLAAAHAIGLVHRDIKPGNLWLEAPNGRVKVLDFGLARPVDSQAELTQSGVIIGTPAYISPEQARGQKVDGRTDLFSLGAVLYRLCTGRLPFEGTSVMAILTALATEEPTPVRERNPEVPVALADLIQRLLAKKAADRPQTADEVVDLIRIIESDAPTATLPQVLYVPIQVTANPESAFADLATDDPNEADAPATPKPARKKSLPWLLIGSALTFLVWTAAAAVVVIKITNKDGTVTEIKVPDGAKIEVDGKPVTPVPKKAEPLPKRTPPEAIPVGQSPFDKLDPNALPKEERFDWQPKELVGVIGSHARRHWGHVNSVTISPDGKLAASHAASRSDCIIVWDMATRQQKWTFPDTSGSGFSYGGSLTFTADSKRLICLSYGRLTTYDLAGDPLKPTSFDLSDKPEGRNDAWHYATLREAGRTLVVSGWDHKVALFDLSNGKPRLGEIKQVVENVGGRVIAGEASQLVYTAADGKLHRATIKGAKFVDHVELAIPLEPKEHPRAVSDDGKVLALWVTDHLELWDIAGEKPRKRLNIKNENGGHVSGDSQYSLSPDSRWLSVKDVATALWRIDGTEPKFAGWLDQTSWGKMGSVAFSADGNQAVVGNSEGFVRFWDLSGAEPKELSPLDPAEAYVSPSWVSCPQIDPRTGRLLMHTFDPPKVGRYRYQLWDFAATAPRQRPGPESPLDANVGTLFPLAAELWLQAAVNGSRSQRYEIRDNRWQMLGEAFREPAYHGIVSGDGKWLIQLSGTKPGEMKLHGWDVSGDPVKKWSVPLAAKAEGSNYPLMFSSGPGTSLAVFPGGGAGAELALYRNTGAKPEQTGTIPIKTGAGLYRAALSPDGRTLAHLKDTHISDIVFENISSGKAKELNRTGEQSGLGPILWLAFSPDGRHLAYANTTGVGVLDAKTLKPVYEWKTAAGMVHWVDWAPDGRHLVTLNGNKTFYVLRLNQFVPAK